MSSKKQLGQFFTTNYNYIFSEFNFIDKLIEPNQTITEPFAGKCDLIKYIEENKPDYLEYFNVELYDIDPKNSNIIENDSLLNPPFINKSSFILTNPPYLALNKSKENNKFVYEKYDKDDLYKCFIVSILQNDILGGAIIIPLNFLSSVRKNDINLRLKFFKHFNIDIINIFEERVFDDTKYSVCAIQFFKKNSENLNDKETVINIFKKSKKEKTFNFNFNTMNYSNNAMIGGCIYDENLYKLNKNIYINRLTKKNKTEIGITRLYVKCIDDNSKKQISMKYLEDDEELYIDETDNLSARSFMTLIIRYNNYSIDEINQRDLAKKFNDFLIEHRNKYNSLFLTNFRESSDIARKRISFSLVYNISNYLLNKFIIS